MLAHTNQFLVIFVELENWRTLRYTLFDLCGPKVVEMCPNHDKLFHLG